MWKVNVLMHSIALRNYFAFISQNNSDNGKSNNNDDIFSFIALIGNYFSIVFCTNTNQWKIAGALPKFGIVTTSW